jgi:hypothetical protein
MIKLLKNAWKRLDWEATDGLAGVDNSLAYRVHEIERHVHSYERWFETAAVANGEVHVADRLGTGGGAFQADAGNDDWGTWLQILGSSDTPELSGSAEFDLHRIAFVAQERNNTQYNVQIGFGASGAAALSAEAYTEFPIKTGGGNSVISPIEIQQRRNTTGTKSWLRLKCPGQNTATLDFLFGIHEYEG